MSKNNYPSPFDIQEVCSHFLKRTILNHWVQSEGIFLVNGSNEQVAETISHLILERKKVEYIRENAYQATATYSMSGFGVNGKTGFSMEDAYNDVRDTDKKLLSEGYKLGVLNKESIGDKTIYYGTLEYEKKRPGRIEFMDSDQGFYAPRSLFLIFKTIYYGTLEYEKKRPGRIEFMDSDQGFSEFKIVELEDGKWQVEVTGSKPNDGKEVKKLFEKILKGHKDVAFSSMEIDKLSAKMTINFFDTLMPIGLGDQWRFEDVKQLTFKRGKEESEDDDEGEDASDSDLMGIKQAILEGKNLRDADFVKKFEKQGCMFTAMTFKYVSINEPKTVYMHAEFKGNPKIFEVALVKYLETNGPDAKPEIATLPKEDSIQLQSLFWNNAKEVYYKVLREG